MFQQQMYKIWSKHSAEWGGASPVLIFSDSESDVFMYKILFSPLVFVAHSISFGGQIKSAIFIFILVLVYSFEDVRNRSPMSFQTRIDSTRSLGSPFAATMPSLSSLLLQMAAFLLFFVILLSAACEFEGLEFRQSSLFIFVSFF